MEKTFAPPQGDGENLMCGIAGYCLHTPILPSPDRLEQMLNAIQKRGPDDEGICLISRQNQTIEFYKTDRTYKALSGLPHIKANTGMRRHDIAFLQTRYAILDLSPSGHQPFVSQDGSIV